jgi:hypothetical protein
MTNIKTIIAVTIIAAMLPVGAYAAGKGKTHSAAAEKSAPFTPKAVEGWDKVKWGMTMDEVKQAEGALTNGRIYENTNKRGVVNGLNMTIFGSGNNDADMDINFHFDDNGGLESVVMHVSSRETFGSGKVCRMLLTKLFDIYGDKSQAVITETKGNYYNPIDAFSVMWPKIPKGSVYYSASGSPDIPFNCSLVYGAFTLVEAPSTK